MSKSAREAFLAGVHVGIVSIADGERGPVAVPVWYDYTPGGDVVFVTDRRSRKGRLLDDVQRISLVAQTEQPPYKYVWVEGPFRIAKSEIERDLRPLARRYLGETGGDRYIESTGGAGSRDGSIVVRLRPERWLSVDMAAT
jgi:nitroimidazol reductase NimA-like FMN-containing flavoprotein (pyridoxamine 5'-phosphate oxidase superfamily)